MLSNKISLVAFPVLFNKLDLTSISFKLLGSAWLLKVPSLLNILKLKSKSCRILVGKVNPPKSDKNCAALPMNRAGLVIAKSL